METLDGLAHIGRNPTDSDNVYIATGDSGMGLTHGTIAGMLLTDLIQGRANPWEALYAPSRKPTGALKDFLRENLSSAVQYSDWLTSGDIESVDALPCGQGAVVRDGLRKLAVYRDVDGQLSACSAVCPHLHALVTWNDSAKTWDCPAHGSRFDCHGTVVNGPANSDLLKAELPTSSAVPVVTSSTAPGA
jgi:Rieske Fe-S protein